MALTLRVPVKFMNSDALPACCLFSGRTDQVTERSLSLDYVHWIIRLVALILLLTAVGWLVAAIVYSLGRRTVSITVPQAPWEKFKWSVLRNLGLPILVLPITAGCLLGAYFDPRRGDGVVYGFLLGFAIGILLAIGVSIWTWAITTSVRAVDMDTVQLRFPDRLSAAYSQYKDAFDTWQAQAPRRRRGAEDEEDWVDAGGGEWDESAGGRSDNKER